MQEAMMAVLLESGIAKLRSLAYLNEIYLGQRTQGFMGLV